MKKAIGTMLFLVWAVFSTLTMMASQKVEKGKLNFIEAKNEISEMLKGSKPLDYERAEFLIENAYWDNEIDYSYFKEAIDYHIGKIREIAKSRNELGKQKIKNDIFGIETPEIQRERYLNALNNFAIFKYLTDTTITLEDSTLNCHLPFKYSIKDPFGNADWQNTQVVGLMDIYRRKGNCYAMASFFKILSERLKTKADLCTAPGHIYINHEDNMGMPCNVELATRSFPGSGTLETITYTTDKATENNISLRRLDLKQSVALCLVYLAKGYEHKFGNKSDAFIMDCAALCLKYDPLNLNAMLLKAEYLEEKANQKPIGNTYFLQYQALIGRLYTLGYRQMPKETKNKIVSLLMRDSAYFSFKNYSPTAFKHARYASLSNGMFEEAQQNKLYEQYGRGIFNTKTKKIVKFVPVQVLKDGYDYDPTLFALSIDPLAGKFPHISPYAAFNNNPIYYVDPTGESGIAYKTNMKNNEGTPIIKVISNVYLYGEANEQMATNLQIDLSKQYNNNGKFFNANVDGAKNEIQFEFKVQIIDKKNVDAKVVEGGYSNLNAENNFYEIKSDLPTAGITFTSKNGKTEMGGNTGAINTIDVETPTASHEFNHGFGGVNNDIKDGGETKLFGNDISIQSKNSTQPNSRAVTQQNIDAIFRNVNFGGKNKANVGNPRPQVYDSKAVDNVRLVPEKP